MENNYAREIISVIVDCKQDPKVEVWEREIVRDFGSRLQVALGEIEKDYEEHKDENPTVRESFFSVLSHIQGIPATLPRGISLGARAVDCLLKIWNTVLRWIDAFIKEHKKELGVDSWSIGATAGFPTGVSGTITVSFKE